MKKTDNAPYTRGSIGGTMLKTACAMLAGTLAMSGYNIVDTYFVGQLGKIPLAAMGFTFPVIMLVGCVFHGLGMGVMTCTSQALGRGRAAKAAKITTSGMLLILIVSIAIALLGMFTAGSVFRRFGAAGETLEQVVGYMNIWYFGCATAALSMAGNSLLVSAGASKTAATLMVLGMLINAVLDPMLISGWFGLPAMGIRGAALATILSQLIATVANGACLRRRGLLTFSLMPRRELAAAWKLMIRYAVPGTLGMLMMPIGSAIITRMTAGFGDTAVAATAAAGRIEMLAFVFPMSLGMTLMPMVGQNFGARLYSRIRDCHNFANGFAFAFLTGMSLIYFFLAPWVVRFFAADPEVRELMVDCLRITTWGFAALEIHRYSGFYYTGCGHPAAAAWLNALRILGLMVPLSVLAWSLGSLKGLFYARMIADVTAGAVGYLLSRRMVFHLPADGTPAPQPPQRNFRTQFVKRLTALAGAQNHIDSSSATQ